MPQQLRISPRLILSAIIALVLLAGLFSSFYTVPMNSVAVVQRFGAYLDTTQPGLHFKLPWGVDTIDGLTEFDVLENQLVKLNR